jgi:LuxR family maltose regulon positive regulatory protein
MNGSVVIAGKLTLPGAPPRMPARERLTRRLEAGHPLTVLCAPAGYGKTTALVEWLAAREAPVAWLALDAQDDEPRRLCAHVLAALDHACPGLAQEAQRALRDGADPLRTVLPLMAAAALPTGLVIALDDYHLIADPACHQWVIALIDALPPGVRIAVASRTRPPLRLARRRVARTLSWLGPEDLRLRGSESRQLLDATLARGLPARRIAALEARAGGWPVALAHLASFGDDALRQLASYVAEEVLDPLAPALRTFLRRTSILRRLCPSSCAAVLDDPDAGALLGEARRLNLFVSEREDGTLRYHALFAELLRRELRADEPALAPELHRRASHWCERAGRLGEAIEHASAAGDGRRAVELIHRYEARLLGADRPAPLRRLLDALPPDCGEYGPYRRALRVVVGGQAEPALLREQLLALERDADAPGVASLVRRSLISPFFGRVAETVEAGVNTLQQAGGEPLAVRGEIAARLGATLWFAGAPARARAVVEPVVGAVYRRWRSWALATLALCAVDQGEAKIAEAHARAAVALNGTDAFAHQALGAALRFRAAYEEAEGALAHAERITRTLPGSLQHALTLTLRAELALARGERERARRAATQARAIVVRHPDVGILADRLATVEALLEHRADDCLLGSPPTPSELRVLALLDADLTLEAIASELYLSVNTVKSHTRRIYRRLGVRSRADAVAAARERGLLDLGGRLVTST